MAFFLRRAVSKQPPSDINFIFILISFLGGVLSYKTYLQVRLLSQDCACRGLAPVWVLIPGVCRSYNLLCWMIQALGPHYAKLTPAVRWLRDKSLGDWTEETFLQARTPHIHSQMILGACTWVQAEKLPIGDSRMLKV